MYQKCPICNGSGQVPPHPGSSATSEQCDVCQGKKIISELTGLPPNYSEGTAPVDIGQGGKGSLSYNTTTFDVCEDCKGAGMVQGPSLYFDTCLKCKGRGKIPKTHGPAVRLDGKTTCPECDGQSPLTLHDCKACNNTGEIQAIHMPPLISQWHDLAMDVLENSPQLIPDKRQEYLDSLEPYRKMNQKEFQKQYQGDFENKNIEHYGFPEGSSIPHEAKALQESTYRMLGIPDHLQGKEAEVCPRCDGASAHWKTSQCSLCKNTGLVPKDQV